MLPTDKLRPLKRVFHSVTAVSPLSGTKLRGCLPLRYIRAISGYLGRFTSSGRHLRQAHPSPPSATLHMCRPPLGHDSFLSGGVAEYPPPARPTEPTEPSEPFLGFFSLGAYARDSSPKIGSKGSVAPREASEVGLESGLDARNLCDCEGSVGRGEGSEGSVIVSTSAL